MTLPKGFKSKVNKKEKGEKSTSITGKENNNNNDADSNDIKVTSATADDFINKQENKIVTDNISPKEEVTVDDIRVDEGAAIITTVTTTPTLEGEVQSETELKVPLHEKEIEVQSETELKVMSSSSSSPPPSSSSLAAAEGESPTTLSSKSIEDYPQNKKVEEKEKMQNIADNSVLLDETKNNIRKSVDEARSQIPRYIQIINDYQEQVIQAAREMADNYVESQQEIINSLQSLWTPFAENIYKINYQWWISPRKVTEVYSRMVSNFANDIILATRLVNNTVFANMEAFKTSMQQAKDNAKDLTRMGINAARTFEQTSNNSNNSKRRGLAQIPKEDVSGVEKVIGEQEGIEGQRKEVNVESYSKTTSLGQILKDLDFPANKDKILHRVQQWNPGRDILSSLQNIEDRQYQNVSDVAKAAGIVY